ncbi:CidA/LrgA family protein [Polycladomyces subterraneus]|uniref:CidA/LrgA family protein n=1 Tax=Polycladomyces subterraneus TaxID=1016997 RepID=A0ABT8IQR0_9BACL|nr:CidA/LrgA family protein [Polycladomyces subterraneus]MDN4595048.1 CidA/LrgA family protein [Polycladomyces subterraneus]
MNGKKLPVWFVAVEILILFLVFLLGNAVVRLMKWPVPPGLLGMGILFILLATGKVRVHLFEVSSQFFVRHIVLLLLPAIVGVFRFWPVLKKEGWKLGLILVVSTITVLVATAGIARMTKAKGEEK